MSIEETEQKDKELHPERYDESLFRRAYKAGLELRKLNEKEKKKKILLQMIMIFFSVVIVSIGIHCIASNMKSPEYISPVVWDVYSSPVLKAPAYIYGFGNIDVDVTAESAIAFDPDSGEVFFEKDISTRRQIASLTKIISSIIVVENFNLVDTITVGEIPKYGEEEIWGMELESGDVMTVENLLKMMLVSSYNDGAIILAESIGSEKFISLMNEKVSTLGLSNTHFANPCGFDNTENYSTADDLRKIVSVFLEYPSLTEIVDNLSVDVEYIRSGEAVKKTIYTTNSMLEKEYVKGIKTGYTEDAGRCLVTLFEYEDKSRLVVILLNSEDREKDTEQIEKIITNLK